MKVQLSLNDNLVEKIDRYAEQTYMSRSGMISFAVTQYLLRNELSLTLKDMSANISQIAESKCIDESVMLKLFEFERLCKSLWE